MTAITKLALAIALAAVAHAQTRAVGGVTAVEHSRIVIRTDAGEESAIPFDGQTKFLRVAPGEKDLSKAAPVAVTDISAGDRILARGGTIIVMAKAEIARKQAADRAEWERRGIGGIVTAINSQAKELVITTQQQKVTLALAGNALLRRYAPESVKFSDAKPSRFEEIQAGDQVRALGNRTGDRFIAEELVSGSFVNIAAAIDAVDAAGKTLTVTDLVSRKKIEVRMTADSTVRRLPEFAARMLASRAAGNGLAAPPPGAANGPQGRREGVPNPRSPSGDGGPGGFTRDRPRDLQTLLERFPAAALGDLKRGDAIAIASSRGPDPSRMTAITVLAGIEPLLAENSSAAPGSWNLDLNMNMSLP